VPVAAAVATPAAAPTPEPVAEPALPDPIPKPNVKPQPAIPAAAPDPAPPAAVPPAKAAVRASLPKLMVAGTSWHPRAERRTATVELEGRADPLELHEGDAVGSLVVREIQPSGVVFLLGDVELRRRVGEQP
jgi:hypothetical protein